MVDRLVRPEAGLTCADAGPVRSCHDPAVGDPVDQWRARTEAVRALLPDEVAARPLVVTSRVPTVVGDPDCGTIPYLESLPAAVVARVTPEQIWPADGAVHPGTDRLPCGGDHVDGLFTAVQVGSWAVGLPPSPHGLDVRCRAGGQARAVVALWLGAAATPSGADHLRAVLDEEDGRAVLTFDDWNDPPMWGAVFAASDVAAALALADRPVDEVGALVRREWATLTDPSTPAAALDELLAPAADRSGPAAVLTSSTAPASASAGP
jgi:hypothetical protein